MVLLFITWMLVPEDFTNPVIRTSMLVLEAFTIPVIRTSLLVLEIFTSPIPVDLHQDYTTEILKTLDNVR
jgi:hypothetical protein